MSAGKETLRPQLMILRATEDGQGIELFGRAGGHDIVYRLSDQAMVLNWIGHLTKHAHMRELERRAAASVEAGRAP